VKAVTAAAIVPAGIGVIAEIVAVPAAMVIVVDVTGAIVVATAARAANVRKSRMTMTAPRPNSRRPS